MLLPMVSLMYHSIKWTLFSSNFKKRDIILGNLHKPPRKPENPNKNPQKAKVPKISPKGSQIPKTGIFLHIWQRWSDLAILPVWCQCIDKHFFELPPNNATNVALTAFHQPLPINPIYFSNGLYIASFISFM